MLVKAGPDLCLAAMAFIAFCKAMRLLRWMVTPFLGCLDAILRDDSVHDSLKILLVLALVCYGARVVLGFIAFYRVAA